MSWADEGSAPCPSCGSHDYEYRAGPPDVRTCLQCGHAEEREERAPEGARSAVVAEIGAALDRVEQRLQRIDEGIAALRAPTETPQD